MSETFTHNGVEYVLPSPNGLTFESKAAAYQLIVRDRTPIYDHGIKIGEEKDLTAEFSGGTGVFHDTQQDYEGNPGTSDYYEIRGHICDTLEQGRRKQWTDEERALVEKKLIVTQAPYAHWLRLKAPAQKPWPTYDNTSFEKIAEIARSIGVVRESIEYERENKNRKTVLADLAKQLAEPEVIEAVEA